MSKHVEYVEKKVTSIFKLGFCLPESKDSTTVKSQVSGIRSVTCMYFALDVTIAQKTKSYIVYFYPLHWLELCCPTYPPTFFPLKLRLYSHQNRQNKNVVFPMTPPLL